MKKVAITLLSMIGILSAMTGSALSNGVGVNVFKGGSGSDMYGSYKVQVFRPSHNLPPVDAETPGPAAKVIHKTIISRVTHYEHETRSQRRKRAIGHRYLGFVKQYRGYKYPF